MHNRLNRLDDARHIMTFCLAIIASAGALNARTQPPAPNTPSAETTAPAAAADPLAAYVMRDDPAFAWKIASTGVANGVRTWIVNLTSQTWRAGSEIDHPAWTHWMRIAVPDNAKHATPILMIDGGRRHTNAPSRIDPMLVQVAKMASAPVVQLPNVPNQPLVFADDDTATPRYEDAIITESWLRYFSTSDAEWIVQLAMVKSVVAAMNATEKILAAAEPPISVDGFIVMGGSKRGWTTWLTAAIDQRVRAIVPAVIDVLNMRESMRHHRESLGFFAPSLGDYDSRGITSRLEDHRADRLLDIVDPYRRRAAYTMPKFIVNSAGDEFFLPDSAQFYYPEMPEPKLLRYTPNVAHNLERMDTVTTIASFCKHVLNGTTTPRMHWDVDEGHITVHTNGAPLRATLWSAHNPDARDFRMQEIGPAYKATDIPLTKTDGGVSCRVALPRPDSGWTASFVELTFPGVDGVALICSTEVTIRPDVLPFATQAE